MKNILFTLALLIPLISFGQTAKEYFQSGYDKNDKGDYYGAISDFTKAIELNPSKNNLATAYYNRGFSKAKLKDQYGAISDYTRAIEIKPNYPEAYLNRGLSKARLEDYKAAIVDYNKAIEIKPNYALAYSNRAIAKELSGIDGCADARKAKELGYNADELIEMICN
jgi:tetratricopeptide (TPR) repeat protein